MGRVGPLFSSRVTTGQQEADDADAHADGSADGSAEEIAGNDPVSLPFRAFADSPEHGFGSFTFLRSLGIAKSAIGNGMPR